MNSPTYPVMTKSSSQKLKSISNEFNFLNSSLTLLSTLAHRTTEGMAAEGTLTRKALDVTDDRLAVDV